MSNLSNFPLTAGQRALAADVEKVRKQRVLIMTAGEGITAGQPLYFKTSDSKVYKANGNAVGEAAYNFIGWALQTASTNDTFEVGLSYSPDQSSLTAGSKYYLSTSAGTISTTPGTAVVFVGTAISATEIVRDYEMRQTYGTVNDNTSVATNTGAGVNTDTTVTHNLGAVPKLVILSATVTPGGSSNSAYVVGIVAYDPSGNVAYGMWKGTNAGGSMTRSQELHGTGSNMSATGIGGVNDTVTVKIMTIGPTSFVFRITAVNSTNNTPISTVTGINWTAIA